MKTPPVQYVRTPDGFSIAYCVSGEGPSLIQVPLTFQHLELIWQENIRGPWLDGLASRFKFVVFDHRGTGLSQRGLPATYSVEDKVVDLETVADQLEMDRFVLLGSASSTHTAVRYAARHPERVAAMILISPSVVSSSIAPPALFRQMSENDWEMFLHFLTPAGRDLEEHTREEGNRGRMVTREDFALISRSFAGTSIETELREVTAPTLVIHPREAEKPSSEDCAEVAVRISGARSVVVQGGREVPAFCDADPGMAAIEDFLVRLPGVEGQPSTSKVDGPTEALSHREIEVLALLGHGRTNPEIADELVISRNTVQNHLKSIFRKINVTNRAQAALYARDHDLT